MSWFTHSTTQQHIKAFWQHMMTRDQPPPQTTDLEKRKLSEVSRRQRKADLERQSSLVLRNAVLGVVACMFVSAVGLAIGFHKEITMTLSMSAFSSQAGRVDRTISGDMPPSGSGLAISVSEIQKYEEKKKDAAVVGGKRIAAEQMAVEQKKKDAAVVEGKRIAAEQMAAEQKKKDAAAALERQRQAFEQLARLPSAVSLNSGMPVGLSEQKTLPVSIGNVAVDELVDFDLALAAPKDSQLKLIENESGESRSWCIKVTAKADLDGKEGKVNLATIYQVEGDGEAAQDDLFIEPTSLGVADMREFQLLSRSALLFSATNPQDRDDRVSRQVNLIRPGRAESGRLRLEDKKKIELGLGVPVVLSRVDSTNKSLGCDEMGLTVEVISPCDLDGQVTETSFRMSEEMRQVDAATGSAIYDVQFLKTDVISCFVHVVFNPDFPRILTVNLVQKSAADPRMKVGLRQAVIEDEKTFKRGKMNSWTQLNQKCKSICDINNCTVHEDVWKSQIESSIRRSLGDRFVNQYFAKQATPLSVSLKKTADKVVSEFKRTPITRQDGLPLILSNAERQGIALNNCLGWWGSDFQDPMRDLFKAAWREYEQSVDALRERLRPLVRDGVTVRVNKVSSTAVCSASGTKYEIVLVDENTELSLDSDQEKQNSVRLD